MFCDTASTRARACVGVECDREGWARRINSWITSASGILPFNGPQKYPAIIAIHGRGTNENDLVPLVLSLSIPNVLLVSPRAPFPFPYGGFVWYDLAHEGVPEPNSFRTSIDMLQKFVGEVKQGYPVDSERVLLLGFSQGTVMAYATALLDPTSFLGVAALSGYIPHRSGLPLKLTNLNGFPVFMSHGSDDSIIPAPIRARVCRTSQACWRDGHLPRISYGARGNRRYNA